MNPLRLLVCILAMSFLCLSFADAKKSKSSGDTYVKGYTRKDGTYVAPHYRSKPNSTKSDNWSASGNINPYTGQEGTKKIEAGTTNGADPGAVYVQGYTRKDGTYVSGHYRSRPNDTKADNWSTKGNVNPYTGEPGTKDEGINRNGPKSASDYFQPKAVRDTQVRQASLSEAWAQLRSNMTKNEIRALLGEPNLKTERKWVYTNAGVVSFETSGIKWETYQR